MTCVAADYSKARKLPASSRPPSREAGCVLCTSQIGMSSGVRVSSPTRQGTGVHGGQDLRHTSIARHSCRYIHTTDC